MIFFVINVGDFDGVNKNETKCFEKYFQENKVNLLLIYLKRNKNYHLGVVRWFFCFYRESDLEKLRQTLIVPWQTDEDGKMKGLTRLKREQREFNFNGKVIVVI